MAAIQFDIQGPIAKLTFNRPEQLNALNREVLEAVKKCVDDLSRRDDIRILILTGAGEKAFIAGADIKQMQNMTPTQANAFAGLGQSVLFGLERLPQVTMAAVNGFALGGGCEVAMACDLIYASEKARFGQPETNLGVIPGFGGTQRLLRYVGAQKAREMIYTGKMIKADEAKSLRLVADVFSSEDLMQNVEGIAKEILKKGPESIRRAKEVLRIGMNVDLETACALERENFGLCFAHSNQREGMAAFIEKREPNSDSK